MSTASDNATHPSDGVISKTASLFPPPSSLPSPLVPRNLFGSSPESLETLRRRLTENHDKYHVFCNDFPLHNHLSHHIIAIWHLGASASVIDEVYGREASVQRPIDFGATPDHEEITDANFKDHLSDTKYYIPYLKFFTSIVEEIGSVAAIEKYIFSPEFNIDPRKSPHQQPAMFQHYFAGFFHPMIHVGYGLEFGLPGMVIEGLAEAACDRARANPLVPDSLFTSRSSSAGSANAISNVATKLSSVVLGPSKSADKPSFRKGPHALNILARLESDAFYHLPGPTIIPTPPLMGKYGERLSSLAGEWIGGEFEELEGVHLTEILETKLEEAIWLVCLIYGVGGWTKDKEFSNDFFTMHLVTASIFLSSNLATLSGRSSYILLRSFFSWSLLLVIMRRDTVLDITGFYEATTPALKGINPWFPILENAITHPDEHYPKLQRSLAHYSSIYGSKRFSKAEIDLPGVDALDGTLFVRVAHLTMLKMQKGLDDAGLTGSGQTQWTAVGFTDFSELPNV